MAVSVAFSTLMVLLSGRNQDLIDLWNLSGGLNDPSGNKHELDLPVVIQDGNFRSAVVDDWQTEAFDSVSVYGMNIFGDIFWETEFNVTGSASFYMDDWLLDSHIVRSSAVTAVTQTVISNDQKNYRLRISPTTSTDKSWFAVSNSSLSYGPLPLIFVPRSASKPFTNPIFSKGPLGCWKFAELVNVEFRYTDAAAMSPTSCIDSCWDRATVAMLANGNECNCADRNTSIDQTDQTMNCYLTCPGSSSDFCGGFGTTVGNAYHVQGSRLPGYVETELLFRTTKYNIKTIQIDISDIFGTSSTPVYATKIILNVTGQVAPEYTVWYSEYNCSESGGNMKVVSFMKPEPTVFQANGSVAAVDILRVRCIQLVLNETALEVSVEIWGPNVSSEHIEVPVLAIRGKRFIQETTTSTSTTSTSTTTTLSTTTSPTTTTTPSSNTSTSVTPTTSTPTTSTPTTSTPSTNTSSTATTSSTNTTSSPTTTSTSIATDSTTSSSPSTTTTPSPSTTASTSTKAPSTTSTNSPTTKSTCFCPCNTTVTQLNLTTAQLQEKIVEIQRRLAVNVSKLSSTIRKLTSAEDKRVSAVSIGYLGVGIMVSILASIVFIDSAVLFRDMKMLFKNIRNGLCPQKERSNS